MSKVVAGFSILVNDDNSITVNLRPDNVENEMSMDDAITIMKKFIEQIDTDILASKIASKIMAAKKSPPLVIPARPGLA